ncbi:MAG: nicotinate-nucleotide--dimethylbenzimidazole phosphoribosyltransferase [Kordiimonadaceae bacterium]|nr:nicotinate-nucleotide--dimethylbenzimidazole phosphoribosyltransferase [Kordiimonadaceae bacterium]MBO6570434.1 nicotinate-nucleotide--dimethylbenzimidazole phosphoribosyltransferase [Kordiimonadaceae bacterium]MBO6965468.1 nicotinate-nucleotide--dimethylbenzimidazole phosphoribosyltransferase [Kordiimonadaceae bacterium]
MLTESPFDDLLNLIDQLPARDEESVQELVDRLIKSHNVKAGRSDAALSWLTWLAGWQGKSKLSLRESHLCLFTSSYAGAGDTQEVEGFAEKAGRGQTALNQLCKDKGLGLRVLELAPSVPHNIDTGWSERECMAACAFGMEATAAGGDMLALSAFSAGADAVAQKLIVSLEGLNQDCPDKRDVLKCFKELAGREIAAMVGAIVAARSRRLPVVVEGWAAIAAMKVLYLVSPEAVAHVRAASSESASQTAVLASMQQEPLLSSFEGLPPGCGLAVALSALSPLISLA